MIKLFRLGNNEFIVQSNSIGLRTECTLQEAVDALFILGVEPVEIKQALHELDSRNHYEADFGINKMLTFTRKQDLAA